MTLGAAPVAPPAPLGSHGIPWEPLRQARDLPSRAAKFQIVTPILEASFSATCKVVS
jgi:hypothetical protein